MKLDLKTVAAIVGTAVTFAVSATIWVPSMADEKVKAQAETQEKADKVQTDNIVELRKQVATLTTAQAVTNINLTNLTEAVAASTKKDDELKLEIKQLIEAIE